MASSSNLKLAGIRGAGRIALLITIIALGLTIRLSVAMSDIPLMGDARIRYHPIAANILAGNGFTRDSLPPRAPDRFDQPAYPLFVAGVYWLTQGSKQAVVVVQLFLELLILGVVGLTARALGFSRRAQFAAIAFGLVSPFLVKYAGLLLTEILATLMLTLACYAFIRATHKHSGNWAWWAISGLLSGLTILVRADTVIAIGLMTLAAFVLDARGAIVRALPHTSVMVVALMLTLAPWTIRNYLRFGAFLPMGTVAQQSRLPYVQWLNTWVDSPEYIKPFWWDVMRPSEPPQFPAAKISDPLERQRASDAIVAAREPNAATDTSMEFKSLATAARQNRPLKTYIGVPVTRVVKTWLYPQINQLPTILKTHLAFYLVYAWWLALTFLAVWGLFKALRYKLYAVVLLLAIIVGRLMLPLISSLGADPRMLVETLPAIYLLAAMLWVSRGDLAQSRRGF